MPQTSQSNSSDSNQNLPINPERINEILSTIENVVLGKPQVCKLALSCLLAQGHLLIEDLPGMGKTTLAHMLATTLGLSYQRTQFTNDLLPADVVGFSIYNSDNKGFELHKGPIFNQVVLADEINRASPKTQSALLEAMAEHQVSIDGVTYELPTPFFVIATQNPLFHAGTYPLPESQLDRFMMRLSLGFPDLKAEKQILLSNTQRTNQVVQPEKSALKDNDLAEESSDQSEVSSQSKSTTQITQEELIAMQNAVSDVNVSNDVIEYIIALSHVSRRAFTKNDGISKGKGSATITAEIDCKPLSPRASKALLQAAKAMAFIDNRDYVLPDDVQAVFYVVCQHRLELQPSHNINLGEQDSASVANQILDAVDVLNPLGH